MHDDVLLRCANAPDSNKMTSEIHEEQHRPHMIHVSQKDFEARYYWLAIENDYLSMSLSAICQIYADKINQPPALLNNMISRWPFSMWGIMELA